MLSEFGLHAAYTLATGPDDAYARACDITDRPHRAPGLGKNPRYLAHQRRKTAACLSNRSDQS